MRYVLCAAALLCCSAARAEPIQITGASATYWSATDTLEINVWYNKPIMVPGAWVVVGSEPIGSGGWFMVDNGQLDRGATFSVRQFDRTGTQQSLIDTFAMELSGRHMTMQIPFSDTGLASPLFSMNTMAYATHNPIDLATNGFAIRSAIDEQIIYTPEPSSVALLLLGSLCLLHRLHSRRSPRADLFAGFRRRSNARR